MIIYFDLRVVCFKVFLYPIFVLLLAVPGYIQAQTGPVIREVIGIEVPPEFRDNSAYLGISAELFNTGSSICSVEGNLNDTPWNGRCVWLDPGESGTMQILFKRGLLGGERYFPNMHGLPGGAMDALFIDRPDSVHKLTFEVYVDALTSLRIAEIRPFGQFTHPMEMTAKKEFFPEPEMHNRFGSWLGGPRLEASGHFRAEKVDGQWWLVDREGYLFWSNGISKIHFMAAKPIILGRSHFYRNLPRSNDPLYRFMDISDGDTAYNFTAAKLYRKYGANWKGKATFNALKRMRNWGINTFGNWSDPEIYLCQENRAPYPVGIHPAFPGSLSAALLANGNQQKEDPYCIGFFIDNELFVNDLSRFAMKQPAEGYAKQAFIAFLKNKYNSIKKLNRQWETGFSAWSDLAKEQTLPDSAENDCRAFDLVIVDRYYKICSEELKKFTPDKLYLGSRLHCHFYPDDRSEEGIIRIAAKYCDIITFNRYRYSAEDLILPEGVDKPVLVGEFHFGALDCGYFHTGLKSAANQEQGAEFYYHYIRGAVENPQIVGAHWFQYNNQAFTGKRDGENYQVGFVDICDNPQIVIVKAARKIGYQLYELRRQQR